MRQKSVNVIDIIRDIVTKTEAAVLAELQLANSLIQAVNFVPGTPIEMTDVLDTMAKQPSLEMKTFPLFGLFIPIIENKGTEIGIDGVEGIKICIAMTSNPTIRTPERMTKNFKPILYPIYYEFLNQLSLDKRLLKTDNNGFKHRKIDWPYYDPESNKNAFNNFVDAIEIKDLELKIKLSNC